MRYKSSSFFILVLLLLNVAVVSCTPVNSPTPPESNISEEILSEEDSIKTAYPGLLQGNDGEENYPAPSGGEVVVQELDDVQIPDLNPVPEAGKAAMGGVLYSRSTKTVMGNFAFYLTPAQGENKDQPPPFSAGPSAELGDIEGKTGVQGEFVLENIPPGNYYLIVQSPNFPIIAVEDLESSTARMFALGEGDAVVVGVVIVE